MEIKLEIKPKIIHRITPQLIATQNLLQLPLAELSYEVEKELEQNPALEQVEELLCPNCQAPIEEAICSNCGYHSKKEEMQEEQTSSVFDEIVYTPEINEGYPETDSKISPPTFDAIIPSTVSLQEYLFLNLRLMVQNKQEIEIGELLIGNIDEQGYLQIELEEVAKELGVNIEKVEEVLKLIQSLEPAGIGARSAQEALLIQIAHLKEEMEIPVLVEEIVKVCFDELLKGEYQKVCKKLKISEEEFQSVLEFIQTHLEPYPGRITNYNFPTNEQIYLKPDVIINQHGDEFTVEIADISTFNLRLNPLYLRLYQEFKNNPQKFSVEEQNHIKGYLERAKTFLKGIQQRRDTLKKITEYLVKTQKEFLIKSKRKFLNSLTQSQLAQELGIHESTVSRATNNKWLQLPWKEIVPFALFFDFSQSIKEEIQEIIDKERLDKPLSDKDIAEIFQQRGLKIARRTIAKYREELGILSSDKRKRINNRKRGDGSE